MVMNRTFFIISAMLVLTVGAAATLYLWREPQVTVISSGAGAQQANLESMLAATGIAYAKNDDGQVTVAESMLGQVRQLAADRGVITPPRDGLETFQDDNYGATEFVQRVNYQRALQAEVERTIIKLDGVLDARVHMRQPQRSTFYRRDEPTRASILVKLDDFAELDRLAPSIAQLAAGAVDGLEASDVNIVADSGVFTSGDAAIGGGGRQQQTLEQHYRRAVASVLKPFYSPDQLGITVTVDIDRRKRVYRRENVPIAASRVATRTSVTPGSDSAGDATEARVDEFAFGVESESIETPAGEISRIGIGVMIADRLTVEEIANIEQLIASTIGVSDGRGDSVKVISYAPESSTPAGVLAVPPSPLIEAPSPIPAPRRSEPRVTGSTAVSASTLSAFRNPGQKELVLMGAGLSGGLLLFGAVSLGRQISRRRMTRDVLAWIEDAGQ